MDIMDIISKAFYLQLKLYTDSDIMMSKTRRGTGMKIIIIGAGKAGSAIAESLQNEKYDITIIDSNQRALDKIEDKLDVLCIKGNGVSANIQLQAGVENAKLFLAVTESDEINMLCCLMAKRLGARQTAARIRDPKYANELLLLKDDIGVDFVINPEYMTAEEVTRSLTFSTAINVESFAKGRVKMVGIKVAGDNPYLGKKLKTLDLQKKLSLLIGVVLRGGQVIVPNGEYEMMTDDIIYVLGSSSSIYSFCGRINKAPQKIKDVMVLGGGKITYYLLKLLTNMGMRVKVIEMDAGRCHELAETFPQALIINGDGTDQELLKSENIESMDGFVAVTGMDEENILASMLAKKQGVEKVISKVTRSGYAKLAMSIGVENVITPQKLIASQVRKCIKGSSVEALHGIIEGQAEILEFKATENSKLVGSPIRKLKLEEGTVIATIVRKNEVVIPNGDDVIKPHDRVIIITKNDLRLEL